MRFYINVESINLTQSIGKIIILDLLTITSCQLGTWRSLESPVFQAGEEMGALGSLGLSGTSLSG
jgi:hypothetical protein